MALGWDGNYNFLFFLKYLLKNCLPNGLKRFAIDNIHIIAKGVPMRSKTGLRRLALMNDINGWNACIFIDIEMVICDRICILKNKITVYIEGLEGEKEFTDKFLGMSQDCLNNFLSLVADFALAKEYYNSKKFNGIS